MSSVSSVLDASPQGYEGRTFGGFRLTRALASGGMATVYLGEGPLHRGIRQVAAVKVVHPHLARESDFIDMFLDETRIVSCIDHPNVCRVLDAGQSDGTYYLAMEYVMGETWADVLSRMSATPGAEKMIMPVLAQVLAQASQGLHAAHEAQDANGKPLDIVHRDVSPHNIMVGYDGSVRVLDFGIATAAERLHTTRSGAVKGRLSYMAPEQMRGMPVDCRADIWSLGVLLWEGLAGGRLFLRDNQAKTVLAVTYEPLPSLASCGRAVPASMERIVKQALQRDCSARFATAREMGLALSRFATEAPVPVGMAELSRCMHRLFAEEIEVKRVLLRDPAAGMGRPAPATGISRLFGAVVEDGRTRPMKRKAANNSSISAVRPIVQQQSRRTYKLLAAGVTLLVAGSLGIAVARDRAVSGSQSKAAVTESKARPASRAAAVAKSVPTSSSLSERAVAASSPPAEEIAEAPGAEGAPDDDAFEADMVFEQEPDLTFELGEIERDPVGSNNPPKRVLGPNLAVELGEIERRAVGSSNPPKRVLGPIKTGVVSVATSGAWADVYLGARKLGTTPMRVSLPVGIHTLRLRRLGTGPEVQRRVTIDSEAAARLSVPMGEPGQQGPG